MSATATKPAHKYTKLDREALVNLRTIYRIMKDEHTSRWNGEYTFAAFQYVETFLVVAKRCCIEMNRSRIHRLIKLQAINSMDSNTQIAVMRGE